MCVRVKLVFLRIKGLKRLLVPQSTPNTPLSIHYSRYKRQRGTHNGLNLLIISSRDAPAHASVRARTHTHRVIIIIHTISMR